jgi:hypothetical protein
MVICTEFITGINYEITTFLLLIIKKISMLKKSFAIKI